jgi:ABC-type transport system involved in multi-copper enzyme maturation permease subunit
VNTSLRIASLTVIALLRDRVLHALTGVALLMFLLIPAFSLFSMRQAQELSVTLCLSCISLLLLVFSTLLGASAIWRDIERRYTASVLGLPISRAGFLFGKFGGIAVFLLGSTALLGAVAVPVIIFSAAQYPSEIPVSWLTFLLAVVGEGCKYVLLAAVALLFSSLSTSFFLPVFGTLAIYLAGCASQDVMEYVSGEFGRQLAPVTKGIIQAVYYLLPNFSALDFKVEAIYSLPVSIGGASLGFLYFLIYTGILLALAVWNFSRRELP